MKILILAPQPFFIERGTPIAVNLLAQALGELGHTTNLLCFPGGTDVTQPGLTIHRVRAPRFLHKIGPGLSLRKVLLDIGLFFKAFSLARRLRPDVVHAVEESVFIARLLKIFLSIPYVYDMDSSIPDQIVEKMPRLKFLLGGMHRLFRRAITGAAVTLPVCDGLGEIVEARYHHPRVEIARDISLLTSTGGATPAGLREGVPADACLFMYIGNLEKYQGVDLMLEAFALHIKRRPGDVLVVIGGTKEHVATYSRMAADLGLGAAARFAGPQPAARMASFFADADVLVSPRITGINTPMKLYSYLDSGKPVLATRLPTHTQAVSDREALLADPEPRPFAEGMFRLAADPELRRQLAAAADALVEQRYSYPAFKAAIARAYETVSKTTGRS